jgi:toxin ParE1/3/4
MAKLPIEYHPAARQEADAVLDCYLERSVAAADAFRLALEDSHVAIQDSPARWASYLYGTRRYLLSKFPYLLVYRATEDRIEVIAVAHGHRKPGYWADRTK